MPFKRRPDAAQNEEAALSDAEKAMRNNPGLRTPDQSRRKLPPEEFPKDAPERKDAETARAKVAKAIESLDKARAQVNPVTSPELAGKLRTAVRILKS